MPTSPLHGLRVLELAGGTAGPFAGKLLAHYGANVIKVEPPGGDRSRFWSSNDEERSGESSPSFLWNNTNKRSIVVELETEEGKALCERLIAVNDIVIEDFKPGKLSALGFDPARLIDDYPGLVICSITPFGQDAPTHTSQRATSLRRRWVAKCTPPGMLSGNHCASQVSSR